MKTSFFTADHPLLEVRSRSLRSVSLKLRGGLLAVESLMHEEAFLSHLLQWFNFPEWGSEQLPLGLIEMMAEVNEYLYLHCSYLHSGP